MAPCDARRDQPAGETQPETRGADRQALVQRSCADRFEIALEHGIGNRRSDAVAREPRQLHRAIAAAPRETVARSMRPTLEALCRAEHPHQICVVHRVQRMVLERAFVQRHRADEEVALIDGAARFREGRRHQDGRLAGVRAQGIEDRTDIAGVGGVEGRADLVHHMACAAFAQPGTRRRARVPRRRDAATERIFSETTTASASGRSRSSAGNADCLDRAQTLLGQRVRQVRGAGVVVGDAAERKGHGWAPVTKSGRARWRPPR